MRWGLSVMSTLGPQDVCLTEVFSILKSIDWEDWGQGLTVEHLYGAILESQCSFNWSVCYMGFGIKL